MVVRGRPVVWHEYECQEQLTVRLQPSGAADAGGRAPKARKKRRGPVMPRRCSLCHTVVVRRHAAILCLALAWLSIACGLTGPSPPATGGWSARGPGHSLLYEMSLQQEGKRITGIACSESAGVVYFSVPVTGMYPIIEFEYVTDHPLQPGVELRTKFSGRMEERGEIVGRLGSWDLRFTPATLRFCPHGRR